jgi:hypothetical protein
METVGLGLPEMETLKRALDPKVNKLLASIFERACARRLQKKELEIYAAAYLMRDRPEEFMQNFAKFCDLHGWRWPETGGQL